MGGPVRDAGLSTPGPADPAAALESTLEHRVGRVLIEARLTIATAESFTGGLLCDRLTNVPGSSAYVLGGVIAYANELKEDLLRVDPETLANYGAVSEQTALEMARGALRCCGADCALSTTGIAGPTGGTAEKPVGLAYIALVTADREWCERHVFTGDRLEIKRQGAEAALQLLLKHLS